ncbi:MAG: ATP-binding protein [Clostridiales bacterium]|jgi:predicted AAA+ superfamily ATPase|nr:ATP-binding protein [Clostridiales bacterium]
MYIKRHSEELIKQKAKKYAAVIVTGARQVGKTTMLKTLYPHIRYLSFDDIDVTETAIQYRKLFFQTYKPPLLLDEVQQYPEIFKQIKMYADADGGRGLFFMTGSQAFPLMKNASESLAGRVGIVDLLGLSLREITGRELREPFLPTEEYLSAAKVQGARPLDNGGLWEIIQKGSMPKLYAEEHNADERLGFYRDYVRTYIERDVRLLTQIGDERAFMSFLRLVAANTAQMLNYTKLAAEIGKSVPTVERWISILQTSGIIRLLQPYSGNLNKRLVKTPKIYFLDTGLCGFLTGWYTAEQMQFGAMSGALYETFVISEIIKSYYNAGRDTDLTFSYYRDKEGREIDLIIEENGTLYPVEIKKTAAPDLFDTKSFDVLRTETTKRVGSGGLIYSGDTEICLRDNIKAIPVALL